MCWTSKEKPILRIAPRNIPVIKILEKREERLFSPVMHNAEWFLGMLALEHDLLPSEKYYSVLYKKYVIEKAFHSYRTRCSELAHSMISWWKEVDRREGLSKTYVMCAAHIPKGAQYYMNEEEYVSNRLIIDKIISDRYFLYH